MYELIQLIKLLFQPIVTVQRNCCCFC